MIKKWSLVIAAIALLCLGVPSFGQTGGSAVCLSTVCGMPGPLDYQYDVSVIDGAIHQFHVGTSDPNLANYTNIAKPDGWTFGIFEILEDHHSPDSPHEAVVQPNGLCGLMAVWTEPDNGPGVQGFSFGYDNPRPDHDVGWFINSGQVSENWSAPVGLGAGAVAGPVPEPGSLVALGSGLFTLGAALIRKRRA